MPAPSEISLLSLLLHADPIVKAVMLVLALASVLSWALAFEASRRQAKLRRMIRMTGGDPGCEPTLARHVLAPAELSAGKSIFGETGGEYLARIERAMREGASQMVAATDAGLTVLATIAAIAPFVGLFGTVWGVMNSFTAIAGANDTSLATVAPGIAEALFATALGLFAAVPAVVAYNRLGAARSRLSKQFDRSLRSAAEDLAARRNPERESGGRARFKAAAE